MIENRLWEMGFLAKTLDYEPEELQENIQERSPSQETEPTENECANLPVCTFIPCSLTILPRLWTRDRVTPRPSFSFYNLHI